MSNDFAERRQEHNPFLQAMNRRCNPHVPCPTPDSCGADRICIYGCQWIPDTPLNRVHLWKMTERYQRHTVDLDPGERHVSDEVHRLDAIAFHVRAKVWGAFVAGLLLGGVLGYYVLPHLVPK